jgi:N-acetylglucosamine kinase-like BadF-type ATPase
MEIAKFAPVVVTAAEEGDPAAEAIMDYAAKELALAAQVVVRALEMEDLAFSVVLTGGIFAGSRLLRERISDRIGQFAPRAQPMLPKAEPVIGAALIALSHADEI